MREQIVYQGYIATHDKIPFYGQIVINRHSGLIVEVISGKIPYPANRIFSDTCLIFPGMGDIHIHAREDQSQKQCYKENYRSAGDAALNGGLVHISAMPNTPNPLTQHEQFSWHRQKITNMEHPVQILNYIGIGKGSRPITRAGVAPYKAFFAKSVGSLSFHGEDELSEALAHYDCHSISFHVEYEPIIQANLAGKTHSDRRPIACINTGLNFLLPLIEKYKIQAKLCHWSTGGDSFDRIAMHRCKATKNGWPYTTIEVSPLHLLFDTSMTDKDPSLWLKIQMNPAIQSPEHRHCLIQGLRDGFINYLATDHAPHSQDEKYRAFAQFKAQYPKLSNIEIATRLENQNSSLFHAVCSQDGISGAPWLDTYACVCVWLMKTQGFSPQDIARVTAFNPGQFVNPFLKHQFPNHDFGNGFGKIEIGYVGSLSILNTERAQIISKKNLQTKVAWSPLEGMQFPGGLEAVIISGIEYQAPNTKSQ